MDVSKLLCPTSQHRDFSSAQVGGAHGMQAVLQRALLCRSCALQRVLPCGTRILPARASITFLCCAGDTGISVQQPGSGQWRALLDIHARTHVLHRKNKGGKVKTVTAERASFFTAASRTSPSSLPLICSYCLCHAPTPLWLPSTIYLPLLFLLLTLVHG